MKYILGVFAVLVGLSYLWYGSIAPQPLTDVEYITKQRVLGVVGTDRELLLTRAADKVLRAKWKVSNDMLKVEKDRRGLGSKYWNLQDNVTDEMLFFTAYYEYNTTTEDFVDSQYGEEDAK